MSSYYPKLKSLIPISPNEPYLYKGNLTDVDSFIKAKSALYDDFQNMPLSEKLRRAYLDLRIYHSLRFGVNELDRFSIDNIIYTSDTTALVYIELNGVFNNIEVPPYQLLPVIGKELISILKECSKEGVSRPFKDLAEGNILSSHRKLFYDDNVRIHEIYMARSNHNLRYSNPLQVTISTSRASLSPLTIAEVEAITSTVIPKQILELEKKRIAIALERVGTGGKTVEEDDDINTELEFSFSLSEFDTLNELMKTKRISEFMRKIGSVKKELNTYIDTADAEPHGILICKYLVFLLNRLEGKRKIRVSTVKDYYSVLKNHLFDKVEDLSNVQTHEINEIILGLSRDGYASKSIGKVRNVIRRFFLFSNQEHNTIAMNLSSYPKSLVFDSELDEVLEQVADKTLSNAKRLGKSIQFKVLRDKAIILIARYTGMRKNELRGRHLSDLYIYDDTLCVDVNSEGMRGLGMHLKTGTARRRICTVIDNVEHMDIIKSYLSARTALTNKGKFLFLDVVRKEIPKEDSLHIMHKIKSKPVSESVFAGISAILQAVTSRYTTLHSLRHSYASYEVKKILDNIDSDPYALIDLSVRMGHESPETTLKIYTHLSVLDFGGVQCH